MKNSSRRASRTSSTSKGARWLASKLAYRSLRESGKALREFNVAYFGASCDTPEDNKEFADELMLDFPLLSDHDRKIALEYGFVVGDKKTPSHWTVYVSKEGKIAFINKEVKAASHADAIIKKLAELKVEKSEKK